MLRSSVFILITFLAACEQKPIAPRAQRIEKDLVIHGDRRVDPYFWLREREDPRVIRYLKQENRYTQTRFKPLAPLVAQIETELRSRIDPTERKSWKTLDRYEYFYQYDEASELPSYWRRLHDLKDSERKIWSPPSSETGVFSRAEVVQVSPNEDWLLWAHDREGRNVYDLHFMDIDSEKELLPPLRNVTREAVIAPDNRRVFYVRADPQTLRNRSVHCLDLTLGTDTLIYDEPDETFGVSIETSRNDDFLFVTSSSSQEDEVFALGWRDPSSPLRLFMPRQSGHRYRIEDGGDRLYVYSNLHSSTFDVFTAARAFPTSTQHWAPVAQSSADRSIEDFAVFKDFVVVQSWQNARPEIEIYPRKNSKPYKLALGPDAYSVQLESNDDFDSDTFSLSIQSLIQPRTVYEFEVATHELKVSHRPTIKNYDARLYQQERIFITARDGEQIPVTLAYAKSTLRDGRAPMYITGYGAYQLNFDPDFDSSLIPLLDRGFVVAIAHIRGGGEYGSRWYDAGRMHRKLNSFFDFIDATEEITRLGYADAKKVYAEGRSAGGLLMGGVINMRPDLYRGVVAGVPFVDVLTTMLDESIPLTTGEYTEWGNPNIAGDYFYMKAYSPYDQSAAKAYPHLFVTAGLNDAQVPYWEAAKWVAKMRADRTCENALLLETNMTAGHTGSAGRYARIHEDARRLAFIIGLEQGLID